MSTSKLGKNQWAELSPQKKNPFELPRLITRHIKQCVESHASGTVAPVENVKYLWISYGSAPVADPETAITATRTLSADEWKNVIDEAASLGVQTMVVSVREGTSPGPDLWEICQWAQKVHDMTVGLFVSDDLDLGLLREVSRLNPARTCMLVPQARAHEAQPFADSGIKVCVSDVGREQRQTPCNGPRNMVYVGQDGMIYPCGLVHGKEQYRMGDALEDPMAPIRKNDSLPWSVKEQSSGDGCDACPNIMDKRMAEPRNEPE